MNQAATRVKDIQRERHIIDAGGQILGRLATRVATLLQGKGKSYYVRHLDCGDYVVVKNARLVKVTGKKEERKLYFRHSGYPGGLRQMTLTVLRATKPTEVIRHAVWGMLPHTKLGRAILKKLTIYPDAGPFSKEKN